MATARGIATISAAFDQAYSKPIDEEAYPLWTKVFENVSDNDLIRAAHKIIALREISRQVTPGEIWKELASLGVKMYNESKGFSDDPIVKALRSRYHGEEETKGITLHAWLSEEKLSSFREAMKKYKDRSATVPVYEMAENNHVA